jgi:hypothetical protein
MNPSLPHLISHLFAPQFSVLRRHCLFSLAQSPEPRQARLARRNLRASAKLCALRPPLGFALNALSQDTNHTTRCRKLSNTGGNWRCSCLASCHLMLVALLGLGEFFFFQTNKKQGKTMSACTERAYIRPTNLRPLSTPITRSHTVSRSLIAHTN